MLSSKAMLRLAKIAWVMEQITTFMFFTGMWSLRGVDVLSYSPEPVRFPWDIFLPGFPDGIFSFIVNLVVVGGPIFTGLGAVIILMIAEFIISRAVVRKLESGSVSLLGWCGVGLCFLIDATSDACELLWIPSGNFFSWREGMNQIWEMLQDPNPLIAAMVVVIFLFSCVWASTDLLIEFLKKLVKDDERRRRLAERVEEEAEAYREAGHPAYA